MLELLRGLSTLLMFVSFIALCVTVYRKSHRQFYDEAALLPFANDRQANQSQIETGEHASLTSFKQKQDKQEQKS